MSSPTTADESERTFESAGSSPEPGRGRRMPWNPFRRRRLSGPGARRKLSVFLIQIALAAGFLVVWQLLSGDPRRGALIDDFYVGQPSRAWDAIQRWTVDGTIWMHSWATLKETLIGFGIGCALGILGGFLLGITRTVGQILVPFVNAANSIPRLALAPLFLLWFGFGVESKVALVVSIVFFLCFYNTFTGAREVNPELVNVLRMMGAKGWQRHLKVTLPSALSWVITGLKVSVPYAFVGAVVGEMIVAQEGLGYLIQQSAENFDPSAMFAAIGALMLMSVLLNGCVSLVENVLLRWRTAATG